MRREMVARDGVQLNCRLDGTDDTSAPTVVFANSLGTDLHLWDSLLPLLPKGLRYIRYDMRGHGKSSVPAAPYSMGQLVGDAEAVCDAFDVSDCMFVGLSVGGMVAQGLAVKRPDLIRAMILSNTAAKIGNPTLWQTRIDTVRSQGLAQMADEVMNRWFSRRLLGTPAVLPWRKMLIATPVEGYVGTCAAISGTDFYTPTSGLRIPTLGVAGSEDGATPPDLVRETTDLVPGSQFALLRKVGHLPCVEDPAGYAKIVNRFLADTGHINSLAK